MASIKRISDRKYLIRVSKGSRKKRDWINETFRGTLADARKRARDLETLIDQGHSIEEIKHTFETYGEKWLKAIKVKEATKNFYRDNLKRASSLNDKRLMAVKPHHIQAIYDDMLDRLLSANTVRHVHQTLKGLFNFATKNEHLTKNPCNNLEVPPKPQSDIQYWDQFEAARVYQICQTSPYGLVVEFALETGMRPEEYFALKRDALNFHFGTVTVKRVLVEKRGGGFYFEEAKTKQSRRTMQLSPSLLARLSSHLQTHSSDLVFPNQIGNPYLKSNFRRLGLAPIIEEAGVKRITLYGMRHTCATLLLLSGENPKVVQERLGHSSIVQTLDTYSHVIPGMQETATMKIDAMLRGSQIPETVELIN